MGESGHKYLFRFRDPYQYSVVVVGAFDPADDPVQLGSGFFVAKGVVATAAHLFQELDDYTNLFVIQIGRDGHIDFHPGGRPSTDLVHDVAAFRVEEPDCQICTAHPVVSIMSLSPEVNEVSGAFGFPHSQIELNGSEARTTLNFTHSAGRVLDLVNEPVPFVPGGAYVANFAIDPGGSGGPVYNSNGFVTAVYSTGVDRNEEEGGPSSSVVPIKHVFNLILDDGDGVLTNVGTLIKASNGWQGRRPNISYERS
jgi:S1-C subfamily serine protease